MGGLSVARVDYMNYINDPETELQNTYEHIFIYPNPASQNIHIKFNNPSITPTAIRAIDTFGRSIGCKKITHLYSNILNVLLSELGIKQDGLYLLLIDSGTKVYARSLVVLIGY